jgi:hypothetical protein
MSEARVAAPLPRYPREVPSESSETLSLAQPQLNRMPSSAHCAGCAAAAPIGRRPQQRAAHTCSGCNTAPPRSGACSVSPAASLCYMCALTAGDDRAQQCLNRRSTPLYRRCPTPLASCSPPFKCFRDTASSRCLSSYRAASACISGFARSLVGLVALINGAHCPLGSLPWLLPNVWLATVCSPVEHAPHRRQPFSLWCLSSNLLRLFDSEQPADGGPATVAGAAEALTAHSLSTIRGTSPIEILSGASLATPTRMQAGSASFLCHMALHC